MAMTIRNKALEAAIRKIGARTGKGPTDVLKSLVELHAKQEAAEAEARVASRKEAMKALLAMRPDLTEEDKRAIDQAAKDMYDENGAPR